MKKLGKFGVMEKQNDKELLMKGAAIFPFYVNGVTKKSASSMKGFINYDWCTSEELSFAHWFIADGDECRHDVIISFRTIFSNN